MKTLPVVMTLLLMLVPFPVLGVTSSNSTYKLVAKPGDSVSFLVSLREAVSINSIFWSRGNHIVAIARPEGFDIKDSSFSGRLTPHNSGYSLFFHDLRKEDSGIYFAKIFTDSTTMNLKFDLQVIDGNMADGVSKMLAHVLVVISLGFLAVLISERT
ncbi:SLAM family member 7-like [Spea bombifrons]|uniref:SLAM family member 7-like n=1 Tax=Spea bombifrons TaxID=233779 RepID=UPI00234A31FA|nr:SLAM family member 7-like [Spea bombifrons]